VSWYREFDDPIPLPRGRQLVTMEGAGNYITKLPKAEHAAPEWQDAMETLMLVATRPADHVVECLEGAKKDLRPHDPGYSLLAVQRPLQPSARLYEPLPVLPDILPVDVSATPSSPMLAEW
jgi:hypothetical protein